MSANEIGDALSRARARLRNAGPRTRRDRGATRFDEAVERRLTELLGGRDRPPMAALHRDLAAHCRERGLAVPARSSLYNAIDRVAVPALPWSSLPDAVTRCLYNLAPAGDDATIAGDVVAFYAFNHGEPRAISFAAGLPWLCLVRAARRRGWRPKSLALLRAVMRYRGLT